MPARPPLRARLEDGRGQEERQGTNSDCFAGAPCGTLFRSRGERREREVESTRRRSRAPKHPPRAGFAQGSDSAEWAPLMAQQVGRRLIAVDRPGFGLSDPGEFERSHFRQYAVDVVIALVGALGLQRADFVGSSVGDVRAHWTGLARSNRVRSLALLGATPLLPGTSVPFPFRLGSTLGVGGLLDKLMPESSADLVVKMVGRGMGEADTIVQMPKTHRPLRSRWFQPYCERSFWQRAPGDHPWTQRVASGAELRRRRARWITATRAARLG